MRRTALYFAAMVFILSAVLQGCRVPGNKYEQSFIESFKTLSFCKCLDYGYSRRLELYLQDASCRYPDYLYGEGSFIDSLARQQAAIIRQGSADSAGSVAEGMEGRRVMAACLEFYSGAQLEALAHARYKADQKLRGR